jgi:hypothetical protein
MACRSHPLSWLFHYRSGHLAGTGFFLIRRNQDRQSSPVAARVSSATLESVRLYALCKMPQHVRHAQGLC